MKEFITQTHTISALNLFTAVCRFYTIFTHVPLSLTVSHVSNMQQHKLVIISDNEQGNHVIINIYDLNTVLGVQY